MQDNLYPIGVDTETKHGRPITFQFYSRQLAIEKILWLPRKGDTHATKLLCEFLDSLTTYRYQHFVLFGHNLSFDMVSLFYDRHAILRDDNIHFAAHGWDIEIIYGSLTFATLTKRGKHVRILDTGAYFPGKLSRLAEIVCPDLEKLQMPRDLGRRFYTSKDRAFCRYAMRDSEIAYYAGVKIINFHKEMNVSISVSAPHFASKVFRHEYMKKPIPLAPRKIVYSALSSYHGGKNNTTVPAGLYKNVYALDIKSAYPYAMAQLPSFYEHDLYRALEGHGTPKSLPEIGIYKITGEAKNCKWPILFNHSFKPLIGEFDGVWVTGFELNEALRCNEVLLSYTRGYYYERESDKNISPFKTYSQDFFERKETATDKLHREFWKLLLNSLYGKFIQTRKSDAMVDLVFDLDDNKLIEDVNLIAGGLFNPFIATLITGHTRAYIHRLEHQYKALHTSTDGIFTQIKPKESEGLGGLSIEVSGDLLLFRNKLYIFYQSLTKKDRRDKTIIRSKIFPQKKVIKYALHGFHGTLETLEMLHKTGAKEYDYVKVNKLRESLRRNLAVNDFQQRHSKLNY